jgi:hypothetical protein
LSRRPSIRWVELYLAFPNLLLPQQKGVSAIAIDPIDVKAIVTAVKKANRKNIPVFMETILAPLDEGIAKEYTG